MNNVESKELILAHVDHFIINELNKGSDMKLVVMNRNRVAKFLGLQTRTFGRTANDKYKPSHVATKKNKA